MTREIARKARREQSGFDFVLLIPQALAKGRDADGSSAKFCGTVAGVSHLDSATSIVPGDRRRAVRFDGMDEGTECGKNRLLWLDGPFERSGVTDDAAHTLMKPISGDLP
ncbi:MAG TPA: hypothetical protein VNS88_16725, partial [Nitrospiraceae bacterium]|nr:hypothetical protein [Nitrospiraceae bacterium]